MTSPKSPLTTRRGKKSASHAADCATASGDPPPVAPVRPANAECCNSGCCPCIFDLYQDQLERYRQERQAWERRQAGGTGTPRKR